MEIVGIDFGTTYVSISTWNPDTPGAGLPQPRIIGRGGTTTMPTVVAFQKMADGSVSVFVGEDADELEEGPDAIVIRDVKRWAQASESKGSYVKWRGDVARLDARLDPPTWWVPPDQQTDMPGHIEVWGQQFSFKEIIAAILKEAVTRFDMPAEFEWRAGCPVHAGYEYRAWLSEALTEISGTGNVKWVIDEPVLFLTLAMSMGSLQPGSFLVYDLGGGSFDCALVEVQDQREMIVYGADGHPWLGGADNDLALERLYRERGYRVHSNLLRLAKEQVSPANSVVPVSAEFNIVWEDVEEILKAGKFIQRSLMAMRDAYISAKAVVWRREEWSDNPDDMVLYKNDKTGEVRFVWQISYDEMVQDLDGIVLFGGTTLSPFFKEKLRPLFGDAKVMAASEIIQGIQVPELVGVSMGACYYLSREQYSHRLQNRLPYWVSLENRQTGEKVEYRPYQYFTDTFHPAEQYTSPEVRQERDNPQDYELTISDIDGVVLERQAVDGYLEPGNRQPATSLRLVIDRLGPVYVEKKSEGVGLSWTKKFKVVENPPWQSERQREIIAVLVEKEQQRMRVGGGVADTKHNPFVQHSDPRD